MLAIEPMSLDLSKFIETVNRWLEKTGWHEF